MRIAYYAIFQYEPDGIDITFPDFPECLSCAFDEEEAKFMARDVLELVLHGMLPQDLPEATPREKICLTEDQKAVWIETELEVRDGKLFAPDVRELDSYDGPEFVSLYRPVGQAELDLIAQSGYRAYPPRLPEQPIFYPVLNKRYAREIAERWNKKSADSGFAGYVTTFDIDSDFVSRYPVQTVGASYHQELWVPAEELEEFNRHILGKIRVI